MNTATGLVGILGIWLTMAMMPLIELLGLSATEATFLRGVSGVILIGAVGIFVRGLVVLPDRQTVRIVVLFVLATICLFQAVTAWGANFSALFLDMALFVPLYFMWRRGQVISSITVLATAGALFGTMLALRVFTDDDFSLVGLGWSLGALLFNGLFIQYAGAATQTNWNKAFWMSVGLLIVGIPAVTGSFAPEATGSIFQFVLLILLFSLATGVLNFYSAFTAFKHLNSVTVGILILGVTPTIMLSSFVLLGRGMGVDQLIGVSITLVSVLLFGQSLRRSSAKRE